MNIINVTPQTRINDQFIYTDRIDATPVCKNIVHPLVVDGPNTPTLRYFADFYLKIGLDIVTETVFKYPYRYISEKTLRPINCKRMFILVSSAHTLKLLHSKGFVTFDDIIDESYDSIENAEERFLSIVNSIEQFCMLDITEIKKYYIHNSWKFDHNWRTLKNLKQLEIQQFKQGQ